MERLFAVIRSRGVGWNNSRPMEEQEDWQSHAASAPCTGPRMAMPGPTFVPLMGTSMGSPAAGPGAFDSQQTSDVIAPVLYNDCASLYAIPLAPLTS